MIYESGRASVRVGLWKLATLASTFIAIVLGVALMSRPAKVVVRTVRVPVLLPKKSIEPEQKDLIYPPLEEPPKVPPGSYLDHRNRVLRFGPEILKGPGKHVSPEGQEILRPLDIHKLQDEEER
mgnify:FL=1